MLMATAKKISTRKSNRQTKSKKSVRSNTGSSPTFGWDRPTLIILGGMVLVVIIVILTVHFGKVVSDKRRFHWAEQRISYARDRLNQATGLDVSSKWSNSCTNTSEQMFKSTLECTAELEASYTVSSQLQATSVESNIDKLIASPQVFGSVVNNITGNMQPATSPADNPQFNVPSKGLYCNWFFMPESSDVKDGAKTVVSFNVSCTAPAAGDIYSNQP